MTIGLSQKTIDNINNVMGKLGCSNWEIDQKDKRYVTYTCYCGDNGRTLKQGITRPTWNGCKNCSTKGCSDRVQEKVKSTLENAGYELISIEKDRVVKYKCKHGEFSSYTSNCQKDNFEGGCQTCRYTKKKTEERVEAIRLEKLQEIIPIIFDKGDWYDGNRHQGTITETPTHIKVIFKAYQGGNSKCFNIEHYGRERAINLANNYKIRESIKRKLSKNMIRDVTVVSHPILTKGYKFKELYLSDEKVMMFENDHYRFVKDESIYLFKPPHTKTDYAKIKGELAHRKLFPEFKEVDHIDRNGLNNLRCNVREGSDRVNANNKSQQKNNTSGTTGVSFEDGPKARWKCQWRDIDGKRQTKSFSVAKWKDDAFEQACAWRYKYHKEKVDKIMERRANKAKEASDDEVEEDDDPPEETAEEYNSRFVLVEDSEDEE